jgi:glycosyltransferase involved in cell wall biosynthesis
MKEINISIIVTARNYGRYLKECLDSCLNQSVVPMEVIYSDDFSEDDSLIVARKFGKSINVLEHKKHLGVVEARNDGVIKSKGNVLVHVDGDDILPFDYLERHLEVLDESTPFVYGAAEAFGTKNVLWKVYTWKDLFLWDRNFVNTSCMMWKDKFIESGIWKETCVKTMWDWNMALRLARFGTPKKSNAVLRYRQHDASYSVTSERADNWENYHNLVNSVRKECVNVTIGLVYSGRLSELMKRWMDQLVQDITTLSNKPDFIIINNSKKDIDFTKGYEDKFSKIKVITGLGDYTYKNERERRNRVCELLSECYNMIIENATGDLIHLREDDIIPETSSFNKLFDFVTEGIPVKAAASGVYLNRNITNEDRFVGGFYNLRQPRATIDISRIDSRNPFKIDFVGTGFLIFWKNICPYFKPYVDGIQAHDWAWSLKLKQMGKELFMLPEASCRHYKTENDFITPKINCMSHGSVKENINNTIKLIKSKQI